MSLAESETLNDSQRKALIVTERVTSCLSILSILFILATFWFSPYFNKPINRLFFFASWGNLGSCIAALISENGPASGATSSLCQFQAFLVQMFLGVDVLWAFCMAINVYLAFFRGYSVKQLRGLDVRYLLFCYGASFVPAFIFIFISTHSRGHLYGPAIIWCWISLEWDPMRIIFLYGPIWLAIVFAFAVYVRAGLVIWRKRRHLNGFLNPLNENPFTGIITTDITVTTSEMQPQTTHEPVGMPEEPPLARPSSTQPITGDGIHPYSVTVDVDPQKRSPQPAILRVRSLTREAAIDEINAEAWLYARVAILFFIALLITWVPSSVNRVYALVAPHSFNFALNYVASLVFPLQAFWNVIVYIITSQTACRKTWEDVWRSRLRTTGNIVHLGSRTNYGVGGIRAGSESARGLTRPRLSSDGSLRELYKGGMPV